MWFCGKLWLEILLAGRLLLVSKETTWIACSSADRRSSCEYFRFDMCHRVYKCIRAEMLGVQTTASTETKKKKNYICILVEFWKRWWLKYDEQSYFWGNRAGVELNWPHYRPISTDSTVSSQASTEAINRNLPFKHYSLCWSVLEPDTKPQVASNTSPLR